MRNAWLEIKDFFHYSHPYKKVSIVIVFTLIVIFLVSTIYLLPHGDVSSIQAGLTLVAEVLGVMLGGALVVAVLLLEQCQSAEELLLAKYKKYSQLVKNNIGLLEVGYKEFIKSLDDKVIALDDSIFTHPNFAPLKTRYKDILGSLVGLMIALNVSEIDKFEKKLKDLGFSEDETSHYIYGGGVSATYDPIEFLKLLGEAFTPIVTWSDERLNKFSSEVFEGFMQEGIDNALRKYKKAHQVLRNKTLPVAIALLSITTASAVFVLFGSTDELIANNIFRLVIFVINLSFLTSMLVTLKVIEQLFI